MRIEQLDLTAYGPFTDAHLDLSAPGLHLVLGANEAGKSSTLAAVTDALFGIPVRTTAGFVHHMTRLEVGMTLRDQRGQVLRFRRLKKAKDALRGPDDEVIDPGELVSFIGGVDRATFTTMFGITHDQLVAGGRDLLAGHGELGELLFGASTGSANLHHTLKQLEDRSAALFKAGGHNPRVNAGISRFKSASSAARDRSLRPRAHDDVVRRIRRLEVALAQGRARLAAHTAERDRVQLLLAVLPNLQAHRALEQVIAELTPVTVRLGPALGTELDAASDAREQARHRAAGAQADAGRLRAAIAHVRVDAALVDAADAIGQLRDRRAQYDQAVVDRPAVAEEQAAARRKAEAAARRWRPGLAFEQVGESLAMPADLLTTIIELGDDHPAIALAADAASARVAQADDELAAARAALDAVPQPADARLLDTAINACQASGDLVARRRAGEAARHAVEREAAVDVAALHLDLPPGQPLPSVRVLAAYAVPSLAVLRHHDEAARTLDRSRTETIDALARARQALADDQRDLQALVERDVPTEAQLLALRRTRDDAWRRLREHRRADAPDVAAPATPDDRPRADDGDRHQLDTDRAQAFGTNHGTDRERDLETDQATDRKTDREMDRATDRGRNLEAELDALIRAADDHADRLRAAAGDVAARARLEADVVVRRAAVERLEAAMAADEQRAAEGAAAWREVWAAVPVTPALPDAMYAWLEGHARVVHHAARLVALDDELAGLDATIDTHRHELRAALDQLSVATPPDASLATLGTVADATRVEIAKVRERRAHLRAEHERLIRVRRTAERDERHASERLVAWQSAWCAALSRAGLDPDLEVAEAVALVGSREAAVDLLDTAARATARLGVLDDFIATFATDVRDLAARLRPALASSDPGVVVRLLVDELEQANAGVQRVAALRRELEEREHEAAEAAQIEAGASARIDALRTEVGVTSEADLREAIARAERLHRAEAELDRLEQELQRQSGGPRAAQLEESLAGRNEADLLAHGLALDAELAEALATLDQDSVELGHLQEQRAAMDGSAGAADAAAEAQMALAEIARDTEEYLAVHLATLLLRDAIAQYREQHQAPLLARARPWFARLTDGSFATLDTDLDTKGHLVLEAVRPDGERVLVSALSEGTRDQLFLALRLAAVALAAERSEPMPLLLDDLFVNFDERRTSAALEIFGELSGEMQVVLFTHHRHVADLAAAALPPHRFHLHHLTARLAPPRPRAAPALEDDGLAEQPARLRPVS